MFTHEINMSENLTAVEGQPHTLTSRVNIFQQKKKKKTLPKHGRINLSISSKVEQTRSKSLINKLYVFHACKY